MSESSKASRPVDLDFELPVEPGYNSLPPKGTWEDGYRLSLAGLEMVKDRPWIWEEREKWRCHVEFKM
jgi:hypothetical protein